MFGKRKVCAAFSPHKTVEGMMGAVAFPVLTTLFFYFSGALGFADFFQRTGLFHALTASALVAGIGVLGDIVESSFKRAAKVKDSSGLFFAHGGMLDKLDSLSLAAPVAYIYFSHVIHVLHGPQ
eukprot:Selendium_serpulae@DN3810_c0_g1_i2.p1